MSSKFFMKSKTILGTLVAVLPIVAPSVGLSTDDVHMIGSLADQLIQLGGLGLAIFGRFKAGGIHIL